MHTTNVYLRFRPYRRDSVDAVSALKFFVFPHQNYSFAFALFPLYDCTIPNPRFETTGTLQKWFRKGSEFLEGTY